MIVPNQFHINAKVGIFLFLGIFILVLIILKFLEFDKIYAIGGSFMMKGDITANCKEINKVLENL